MSPRPPAARGDPVQPADIDAVIENDERASWQILHSEPRWQIWREHNRRRPPTRAEKRGKIAAATAGTIIGVLGVVGAASYAVQWQGVLNSAYTELGSSPTEYLQIADVVADPSAKVGLEGVVNGEAVAWTPNAARQAADKDFAAMVGRSDKSWESYFVTGESWFSLSTACVYEIHPLQWTDGKAAVVRIVDLTATRDDMNRGYLAYGLIGLGVAGAAAGTVYWRLGRKLNKKVEPDTV